MNEALQAALASRGMAYHSLMDYDLQLAEVHAVIHVCMPTVECPYNIHVYNVGSRNTQSLHTLYILYCAIFNGCMSCRCVLTGVVLCWSWLCYWRLLLCMLPHS